MTAPRLCSGLARPSQSALLLATTLLLTGWIAQGAQDEVATAAARLRQLYQQRDYHTAVREGAGWPARAPEAFELRAWYALNLARTDKVEQAVSEAEAMVEADSANPWCWFALAGALAWHSERGEEALDASERALTMSPDHIDFIALRAFVIRRQESAAASVAFIDALPAEVQEDPLVLVRKAVALNFLADEQDDDSIADESNAVFEKARAADPQNVEAHFLAGAYLLTDRRNEEAHTLLKRAADLSPSEEVHQQYWRAVMARQDVSDDEQRTEIEADVATLLERRSDSPSVLYAVATVCEDLEMEEKEKEYKDRILELYPESRSAEWVLYDRYMAVYREMYEEKQETGIEDPEKRERYRQLLLDFVKRPQHEEERLLGSAYRSLLRLIKDEPDTDPEYLYEVVQGMLEHGSGSDASANYMAAIALADHKIHFEVAESLAAESAVGMAEMVESMRESGIYETEGEYQEVLDYYESQVHDALGWVYFNQNRLEDAEEELLAAYDLYHESMGALHHLGQFYETRHDLAVAAERGQGQLGPDEASAYLETAEGYYIKGVMVQSMGENPNDEALKTLYERRHGTLEGFEDYLANAEELDRERRHEKILGERLEDPRLMEPFALKTLSGLYVPSSLFSGKILVVNFWGTWCGPCVAEMPEIQEVHEKYRDDRDVVFLTINNDDDPDDVREWMKEREFDFAVLLDDGYNDRAGIRGYPTTWFIDRQGRIGFSKLGWSEALTEEFGWRVEALRGSEDD